MIIFGHRGAIGYAFENSMASFKKALELNCKWIELDVYNVENNLIVFHDDRLERCTDGFGRIADKTYSEISALHLKNGERIPLLEEVLNIVGCDSSVNIELKGENTAYLTAELISDFLKKGWSKEQFLISSFNHVELNKIHELDHTLRIGALTSSIPINYSEFAQKMNAYSIHCSLDFINSEYVDDAHRRGLKVFVYTINDVDEFYRMKLLGVDGIFSDYPDMFPLEITEEIL